MTLNPVPVVLERRSSVSKPEPGEFKVSAIGSCRVVGPLRRAGRDAGFKLNQSGVFGYCHSSSEALQQLRVLQDDLILPDYLLPVLAPRSVDNPDARTLHDPSDMYFVELSSAKILSVDGFCIQLNYFTRHFESFFEDRNRSRAFWRAVREDDTAARKEVLDASPSRLPQDRYLLENLRMSMSTAEGLAADISAIKSMVPNVLFVTHFNARKHDGMRLAARETYLRTLRHALKSCAVRYFDPTDYVEAFGQTLALKDPNGSLSHYSDDFETYLCDNWVTRYIQPLAQLHAGQPDRVTFIREPAHTTAAAG